MIFHRSYLSAVAGISGLSVLASIFHCLGSLRMAVFTDVGQMYGCGFQPQQRHRAEETLSIVLDNRTSLEDLPEEELVLRRRWVLKPRHANHLDVGVLIYGHEEKLVRFATAYGDAIQSFREQVHSRQQHPVEFRLLITRYPSDNSSWMFRQQLADAVGVPTNNVVFVMERSLEFNRGQARNILHNRSFRDIGHKNAVLAMVDVDMWIGPRFLLNSLTKTGPGNVYFPVVFSDYRPSSVLLVEKFLGPQTRYSEHRGMWRDFGYGMYALTSNNAGRLLMSEGFEGWGGEDVEFYNRVQDKGFRIVRRREYDLIHIWHPKYCDTRFVRSKKASACTRSRNHLEGSSFGRYLLKNFFEDYSNLDLQVQNSNYGLGLAKIRSISRKEYEIGKAPEDEETELTAKASVNSTSRSSKLDDFRSQTLPDENVIVMNGAIVGDGSSESRVSVLATST